MSYRENPKTKDSGIHCCIPQTGTCPNNCADCFFQSGRSYLEPLTKNLPNIPICEPWNLVWINDGNDSNVDRETVVKTAEQFPCKFFHTAIPRDLEDFNAPVVLTLNPAEKTDKDFYKLEKIPSNLMFVRVRVNAWNLESVVTPAIDYYTQREVPVILTFMAYFDETIPKDHLHWYKFCKRTLNEYWVISREGWNYVTFLYEKNKWVHTCGKSADVHACRFCGHCHREWFVTQERMRKQKES